MEHRLQQRVILLPDPVDALRADELVPSSAEIIRSTSVPPPFDTARASIRAALKPSGWKRSGTWLSRFMRFTSHVLTLFFGEA